MKLTNQLHEVELAAKIDQVDVILRMFRDSILNSSTIINISISTYLVNLDIFLVNFVITGLPAFVGTGWRIFLH